MNIEQFAIQNALKFRLDTLRIRYPSYSVRAFAKKIGISPATLSLMLNGKRAVSYKLARLISDRLQFDPQEQSEIFSNYLTQKTKSREVAASEAYAQLNNDQYHLLSDWKTFAILNLINCIDFQSDKKWIASRLGVPEESVLVVIDRLKRLNMLSEKNKKLCRTKPKYRTTEDIANLSLQKSHHQTLELAGASLANDPVEDRDFTWVTFAFDSKKMSETKALIRKFQDDLLSIVEKEAAPQDVYRLSIQLFPLTKSNKKKEKNL